MSATPKTFTSFKEFYPYYLSEHQNQTCRRLHVVGSTGVLWCLFKLLSTGNPGWFAAGLVCGYGFAWVGHFVFEKNRPATFKNPGYSFMGDWVMYKDILTGRIPF